MKNIEKLEEIQILLEKGEIDEAIPLYNRLFEKYPKDAELYVTIIGLLGDEFIMTKIGWKSLSETIRICDLAVENLLSDERLYFYMKKLYVYLFYLENKKEWYNNEDFILSYVNELQEKYPKEKEIYKKKGDLEVYLGQEEEALTDYNTAIKLSGKYDDELYLSRDMLLIRLGRKQEAIQEYEQMLKDKNIIDKLLFEKICTNLINLYNQVDDQKVLYYKNLLNEIS